jgi:DNA-binding NarL/FixJ family response regulator
MTVRVLLVDDQAPFRTAARTVVELTEGFEVAGESATGEDAVAAARSIRPDLILMDVNLPGIDGTEATRRILALPAAATSAAVAAAGAAAASPPAAPVVILLSTYDAVEYAPRAPECGAAAYVPKSELDGERLVHIWLSARPTRAPS